VDNFGPPAVLVYATHQLSVTMTPLRISQLVVVAGVLMCLHFVTPAISAQNVARTSTEVVHRCNTRYAESPQSVTARSTLRPPSGYAFYSDAKYALPPVVAPLGWQCTAAVYEDGTVSFVLKPSITSFRDVGLDRLDALHGPAVVFYNSSSCSGCNFAITCSRLLPNRVPMGWGPCPHGHSNVERRGRPLRKALIMATSFFDPPHVWGMGWPSGGTLSASGVLLIRTGSQPSASLMTCQSDNQTICAPIARYFIQSAWRLRGWGPG